MLRQKQLRETENKLEWEKNLLSTFDIGMLLETHKEL